MFSSPRFSVKCVRKPSEARALYEPMRREILRLLAKNPMTQTQLAKQLGLTVPTVGYHLSALKAIDYVSIVNEEAGSHGIVEKQYGSNAQLYYIDRKIMPLEVRRYYMPLDIERARGVLACAMMMQKNFDPSPDLIESFAHSLSRVIADVAYKYEIPISDRDPEAIIGRVYSEALEKLLKTSFPDLGSALSPR